MPENQPIAIEADWNVPAAPADARPLVVAAVVGESPAVVTETLWWLFKHRPHDRPERIVIFTTTAGRKLIRGKYDDPTTVPPTHRSQPLAGLPSSHHAWEEDDLMLALCRLCREWQRLVPIVEIHVPPGEGGREIQDIRTAADDRGFGNRVFQKIRELTERPDAPVVHASIAGGRKTMGTRLASVLSMFGRPQDELSHVLVTDRELEGAGYWCPSEQPGTPVRITYRDGTTKKRDVSEGSVVQLVYQRFWPLRGLIDEPVLKGEKEINLDELELVIESMVNSPPVSFHNPSHTVTVGAPAAPRARPSFRARFALQPAQYALYRTLVAAKAGEISSEFEITPDGYLQALDFAPRDFGGHATLADGSLRPFAVAGTYFLGLEANARTTLAHHADAPNGTVKENKFPGKIPWPHGQAHQ